MALGRRLPLALAVLALAGCGGAKHAAQTTTDSSGCTDVSQPKPESRTESKPKHALDASKTYDVRFVTNCGSFTIRLAVKTSPATTASFASLVTKQYFDHTIFHRIVPSFVIQAGDPTASGGGGPGYSTVDPVPAATQYTTGLAAMAKTNAEAPGTAGSQFFVVTGKNVGLPPDYAVLGHVVAGADVVRRIGQLGDPASGGQGTPTKIVEIERATLHVS
jgi:cyclophilin family peptidyl-prolyl cis-trans isomerase